MSLENRLMELSTANDWRAVVNVFSVCDLDQKSRFSWAWPTFDNLERLRALLDDNDIDTILSVGCGSGLLEWVIQRAIGVNVIGVELDNSWWKSQYAPKTFIDLEFACEVSLSADVLSGFTKRSPERFALMFSYFNNRDAFLSYVRAYRGSFVIIIGPVGHVNIVTDPMPLDPMFEDDEWAQLAVMKMQGQENCMAIYKRQSDIRSNE